jgi:hypothetical protein
LLLFLMMTIMTMGAFGNRSLNDPSGFVSEIMRYRQKKIQSVRSERGF